MPLTNQNFQDTVTLQLKMYVPEFHVDIGTVDNRLKIQNFFVVA
jgi:hypothetical protein